MGLTPVRPSQTGETWIQGRRLFFSPSTGTQFNTAPDALLAQGELGVCFTAEVHLSLLQCFHVGLFLLRCRT